jgi:hypothetical protein
MGRDCARLEITGDEDESRFVFMCIMCGGLVGELAWGKAKGDGLFYSRGDMIGVCVL